MSLELVVNNEEPSSKPGQGREVKALPPASVETTASTKRPSVPELPPTPQGAVPIALAQLLRSQEPVVWWSSKQTIEWQPAAWAAGAGLLLLTFASLFAPSLWSQPLLDLVSVVLATQAVAIAILVREFTSRRHVVVTDTSIADIDWRGRGDRIAFRNVRQVRRDWWSGGVRLIGEAHEVRVPPSLMNDARDAIAHQMAFTLDFGNVKPDDRLSWFPGAGS